QDFSESATIAQVYGQYLKGKGYKVDILTPAGFRTEAIAALESGDVNLIVDYIGGAATALAPDTRATADPTQVVGIITPAFSAKGATVFNFSPAVDGDALVVRGDSPATKISDLKTLDYVLGASAQCEERPQCYIGFTDPAVYGITFKEYKKIDFGPQLGEALVANEVDAVVWNTTAPQIEERGFKVLQDDKGLFPAQNIAPIVSTSVSAAYGQRLVQDLNAVSAAITTDDLVAWNVETDIKFRESEDVASDWLKAKGLAG
ncbi:MAG TPA: glycine betaine ABC transporter substrate-binding protein, partial [Acidimicrobiales bacterium]|nr:glycine betaine ABC transporter substrate-binding protein [Acidimicrobiales bacterium]